MPAADDQSGDMPMVADKVAGTPIPGQYIVVYKKGAVGQVPMVRNLVAQGDAEVVMTYTGSVNGTVLKNVSDAEKLGLEDDPSVDFVEQDQWVTISATQSPATWGLDRTDQRNLPLSNSYTYTATGSGVRAYIVDTGILTTHTQFGGRASFGYDAIGDGRNGVDCNGHGTHVAGTVGGSTYGIAKNVSLVAVRVLNCTGSGTNSGVIAGVNWVTNNAVKPAVANMSLGGGVSTALDNAVAASIASGVTYAVAAGNSNANACNSSPSRTPTAITVGATTSTDARASYSNYGTCLDIFGPGSSITSAWYTSTTATNTISGTSMATPHVAGVAALYLQGNPTASAATVRNAIVANGTTGKVTNPRTGSPNILLFSNY
jgi:subtilisin family serine protease